MGNTRNPTLFLIVSLLILFAPGIGDLRWVGLVSFIYIGLPWYILAVKDKVKDKIITERKDNKGFKIHSPTLLIFGLICLFMGVGIDLFIMYKIYLEPSETNITQALVRLFTGVPFFGFGAYLFYLSFGKVTSET